jgi:hypothetical protein
MDNTETFIHAGLPRTGTTTLQTHLFARHTQVHYLGVFKGKLARERPPIDRSSRGLTLFRDSQVEALMSELLFDGAGKPDFERAAAAWSRICESSPRPRRVWSWEGLGTDVAEKREARAANLARILRPAKVLITLRHPVRLLESTYFQILRRNNNRDNNPGWKGTVWYQPIDEWLDRHWGGELEPILDYARTVEIFQRHFGRESVRVMLYEDLARDPAAYVAEVCRLAGIDEEEGVQRTAGRLENPTSKRLVDTVRRSRERPLGFLRTKIAVTLELRGWARSGTANRAAQALDESRRQRVAERTRDGNRRLRDELGLDLARYDYPM